MTIPLNTSFSQVLVGKGNQMQTKTVFDAIDVYGTYRIGETPNNDEWITDGNPSVLADTWQGTQGIDKTQTADNKSQHNKLDGNTGWTLLSEMGRQVLVEDEFDIIFNPPAPYLLEYSSTNNQHEPNINVFSSINPWSVPQGVWEIEEVHYYAYSNYGSGASIALLDALVNCEIKMVIELNSPGFSTHCGIEFRHDTNTHYWRFSIENDSGIFYARLYRGSSLIFTTASLTIPNSNIFVLKVKLSNSLISIFLNDLLLFTTNDASYIGATKHGMRSISNKYHVHSFKIIK